MNKMGKCSKGEWIGEGQSKKVMILWSLTGIGSSNGLFQWQLNNKLGAQLWLWHLNKTMGAPKQGSWSTLITVGAVWCSC
jgi:hypothetical protein